MIRKVNILFAALIAVGTAFASNSYAGTASLTKSFKSGTVYASTSNSFGGVTLAYNDFVKGAFVPGGGFPKITSISYTWTPYTNGRTNEKVELCYRQWNSSTADIVCTVPISDGQTGNTTALNNVELNYGTGFYIRHTLTGGTYPALRPAAGDSFTINYSY